MTGREGRMPPRRMAVAVVVTLGLGVAGSTAVAGNGDSVHGYPTYRERAILALTNACRQGPQAYRDTYLAGARILRPSAYPAVPPLYWTLPLNQSARAHSVDMAATPCFQHESCDGTDPFERIRSYYPGANAMAENIAAGCDAAREAVGGWLLDGGAADHSRGDGHRRNIMSARYSEMGVGSALGGPDRVYDTQDFGSGAPDFTTPLVSGSHVLAAGNITFLASYDSRGDDAPKEAALRIDDETIPMKLAFGAPANGTYRVTLPAGDECRKYRFEFRDASGREWWYPENGTLFTTGEGGCDREYEPSGKKAR